MRNSKLLETSFFLSLPEKIKLLRKSAEVLNQKADSAEAIIGRINRSRLDSLRLTDNTKVDSALRLSLEASPCNNKSRLAAFPVILEKIEAFEKVLAGCQKDGILLVDLTSQRFGPICLQFVVLEMPANPALQFTTVSGYFPDIPISVQIPGRLMAAWNSSTLLWLGRYIDFTGEEYCFSADDLRMEVVSKERFSGSPIASTFDLTQLLHPNWGSFANPFAGITLGLPAITNHVEEWKSFVNLGYGMDSRRIEWYLKFLDDFLGLARSFTPALV